MIHPERVELLNNRDARSGRYVLYWMQASQRSRCNHAIEYAISEANKANLPLVAVFGITDNYPEANLRHYAFMLEGLAQTRAALEKRGVQLVVLHQSPEKAAIDLADDAAMLVVDRGYLRIQREWRLAAARAAKCPVIQVESDVVVPANTASDKEEFAARTIRPKIHRELAKFLVPLREAKLKRDSLALQFDGLKRVDVRDTDALLAKLKIDRSVTRVADYRGGEDEAEKMLTAFVRRKLAGYNDDRKDPTLDGVSHMSPYLHFGQVSPIDIALRVQEAEAPKTAKEAYLEELIVRRELSMNFVLKNSDYDSYNCLPAWAKATLRTHARDKRPVVYSAKELEEARTGDAYWNAAQREMVLTGKMHNYMRMYWGKKIIEWSETPEEAFRVALYLNNKYELDGRDANSFTGVAWCFGKHDRPWGERAIFGTVRYMNAKGLERKFDAAAYVKKVDAIAKRS